MPSIGSPIDSLTESLADGVHVIRVPIPDNPLGYTMSYVLESDAGPVIVDPGWNEPEPEIALRKGVAELGFDLADVHGVLVTHQHPDHHGLSGVVREASGCWVAMHPADTALVRKHHEWVRQGLDGWRQFSDDMFMIAGATRHDLGELPQHDASEDLALPAIPDLDLVDGQLADVPGRDVRTVWTPGHSPGHTSFILEESMSLLAGDHILPKITPHIGLYDPADHDGDPLGEFLASLDRIEGFGIRHVLPAHRHRFDDLAGRVAEIRTHHEHRLAEVMDVLADVGPSTPWAVSLRLTWNVDFEKIPLVMRRAALAESTAHLRYLERTGKVKLVNANPLTYRPVAGIQ